jgi:hypothetical protein
MPASYAFRPTLTPLRATSLTPPFLRAVGFLVVSLLDKSHLASAFSGDTWGGDGPAAWRARVVLFIGVALMAGGLAGSLVSGQKGIRNRSITRHLRD